MREPKTRHGATQPEDERKAKGVFLRLRPSTKRQLDQFAKLRGVDRSAAIGLLLMAACACDSDRLCVVHDKEASVAS